MFDGITSEAAAGTAMGTLGADRRTSDSNRNGSAWPIANKLGKTKKAVTIGSGKFRLWEVWSAFWIFTILPLYVLV